jgi:ribosomal protein RSM22 (predicted rRNA methylase)
MTINWKLLVELRERFLSNPRGDDYWTTPGLMESYDLTFAERIGWKWDYLATEIKRRGFNWPESAELLDWGCGTGIAARRLSHHFSDLKKIQLWDRSETAMAFARDKLAPAGVATRKWNEKPLTNTVVALSHVANELTSGNLKKLIRFLAAEASAVLWVEPGTPEVSRKLIEARESLKDEFSLVAPCPHSGRCGLFQGKTADWCHQFATIPNEAFTTAFWRKFSEELKIDLRSLPMSYLVMEKKKSLTLNLPPTQELGRPRVYKGYANLLICEEAGVTQRKVLKRDDQELFKKLKDRT